VLILPPHGHFIPSDPADTTQIQVSKTAVARWHGCPRHFDWFYSIFETATEETKQNLSFENLQERTTAVTVSQQCLQAEKARSTRDHKFCRFLPTPTLSFVESTNLRLLAYTRRKPELSCATTAYYHLVPFVP
jgi:hypothetical protein